LLEESCDIALRSGHLDPLRWAHALLAERDIVAGQAEAARARIVPLLEQPGQEGSNVTLLISMLAWAYLELGELGQADACDEQAIGRARAANDRRMLVNALRIQALVRARQGRWVEAKGALEEGLDLARSMPHLYMEGQLLHDYGLIHVKQRQTEQAGEQLAAALAIFRGLGARKDIERTERLLAVLC
jgi:tetratricopeptide (TPR) repeat protein